MARRYVRAFGLHNFAVLAARTLKAKLDDRFGTGAGSLRRVARRFGVRCVQAEDVNDPGFLSHLRELGTDLIVSVSCPQIFRRPLIDLPPRGCLNMHGALLPKYRGIAPSFWMMANGEREAGVTLFFVNENIDAGEVVAVERFSIEPTETLEAFILRSKGIACELLLRTLDRIERGTVETSPLDTKNGSYFGFPTRDDYRRFRAHGRKLW